MSRRLLVFDTASKETAVLLKTTIEVHHKNSDVVKIELTNGLEGPYGLTAMGADEEVQNVFGFCGDWYLGFRMGKGEYIPHKKKITPDGQLVNSD
jgi:hypothetical protein